MAYGDKYYPQTLGGEILVHNSTTTYKAGDRVMYQGMLITPWTSAPASASVSFGSGAGKWRLWTYNKPYRRVTLTSGGAWFQPSPDALLTVVEIQGAGGGGASAKENTCEFGESAVGGNGAGGAYFKGWCPGYVAKGNTVWLSVGSPGTRGTSVGGQNGGDGGHSQVTSGNSVVRGGGGKGGQVGPTASKLAHESPSSVGGSIYIAGGWLFTSMLEIAGTNSQVVGTAAPGNTTRLAGSNTFGGYSFMGGAASTSVAVGGSNSVSVVASGAGYGYGGCGTWVTGTGTAATITTAGGGGYISITEYF